LELFFFPPKHQDGENAFFGGYADYIGENRVFFSA